jgi:predicted cupin superfamily sugar epimerase
MSKLTAGEVIAQLGLEPHNEGGFYRQTFADRPDASGRPLSTLIYYLLANNQSGAWHRVDVTEIWHWYAGVPMLLEVSRDGKSVTTHRLGANLITGERPQLVVPGGAWQRATVDGDWSLVGCTVAPGFQFSKFEQAPPGWQPGGGSATPS